jgi:hypothetical protein
MRSVDRALEGTAAVYAASAASVIIACVFIFVWAPHPWGWEGFDHYHDLGRLLARGEAFPTTDVPWGYAFFLAPFYRLFGDRPWVPLLAQALLNGLVPIMLYRLVSLEFDRRTGVAAAVLTGFFSFNTLYASTQSSDAVCTVVFVAALLLFAEGRARGRLLSFAGSGALFGLAPQFRPNLVMLPAALAGLYLLGSPRSRAKVAQMLVYLVAVAVVLTPWTARNYRLLGLLLPTSTHGGVQLWYGTLQAGPYLQSRVYNPRSAFEFSGFDYSSVAGRPVLVSAEVHPCASASPASVELVYWTDRRREPVRLPASRSQGPEFSWNVPGQPIPTVLYYFVEARWPPDEDARQGVIERLPAGGVDQPAVHFVNDAHLMDLDQQGDLLDVFDVIRLARSVAWNEPLLHADRLDLDGDGRVTERDLRRAADILMRSQPGRLEPGDVVAGFRTEATRAVIEFSDSSTLSVPRSSSGRLSDIVPEGEYAGRLVNAAVPFSTVAERTPDRPANVHECRPLRKLGVNRAFYLAEPDSMRRYTALAWDNIRHDPGAYFTSCVYRVWRLFVVQGTDDRHTAVQFRGSRLVYKAATAVSVTYLLLFVCGVILALRQHRPMLIIGAPIAYIPITIAWVLTNMRYTVTVQPLLFAFIAVTLLAARDRAGNRTGRRP